MKIAIVAVAFNRIESISRLLKSIDKAYYPEKVTLIISIDKSDTDIVEKYAHQFNWTHGEKRIVLQSYNLGLRAHMLSLGRYFDEFDALIILEDDVSVSPSFYLYTKACVQKYHRDKQIAGISLYSPRMNYISLHPFIPTPNRFDVYFVKSAFSWGEVWMKEQWIAFINWYKQNNEDIIMSESIPLPLSQWSEKSWLKYHMLYCLKNNKYFVVPYVSLSTNNADIGTHISVRDTSCQVAILNDIKSDYNLPDKIHLAAHYDEFYEDETLYDTLGLSEKDLILNLMCSHHNLTYKQYLLTPIVLNYKIIKHFGLFLRPISENVKCNSSGYGIYLYDTRVVKNNNNDTNLHLNEYLYPYSITLLRRISGFNKIFFCLIRKFSNVLLRKSNRFLFN